MQNFITIFLFICCIVLFCIITFKKWQTNTINEDIRKENEKIYKENENLLEKQRLINSFYEQKQKELNTIQKAIEESEQISRNAFEKYLDNLDKEYEDKEREYHEAVQLLNNSYEKIQNKINAEINQTRVDLDKIASTRAAAIQAQLEEEKIQQQAEYYSISINNIDKKEIKVLQSIENELRDPRPVRMIIWQTYYSKKANELASRVLGANEKCGIYKITNKINKLCYIGQAKNIRERWREHMKCGLGIDTPANNKLYQAMYKEGLDNFTFEILEECAAANLNEKEAFYISLYNSYDYGYNSNRGIKKS